MKSKCGTEMVEVATWLEEGMEETEGQEGDQRSRSIIKPGGEHSGTSHKRAPWRGIVRKHTLLEPVPRGK